MDIKSLEEAEAKPVRDVVRSQRFTQAQWSEIEAAAKIAGMSISRFIRACALTQAREILEQKKRPGKVR